MDLSNHLSANFLHPSLSSTVTSSSRSLHGASLTQSFRSSPLASRIDVTIEMAKLGEEFVPLIRRTMPLSLLLIGKDYGPVLDLMSVILTTTYYPWMLILSLIDCFLITCFADSVNPDLIGQREAARSNDASPVSISNHRLRCTIVTVIKLPPVLRTRMSFFSFFTEFSILILN